MKRPLTALLACFWFVPACLGQEVWYLTPRAYHSAHTNSAIPDPSEPTIDIRITRDRGAADADGMAAREGQPADGLAFPTPFPSQIASHVFVRGGPMQWNLHRPEPIEEGSAWTRVPMPRVGAVMIGLECDPVIETYTSDQLRAFINEHAPAFVAMAIPERDNIRVRVVRCAKTLVRIDDGRTEGMPSPISTSRAGQRNEIRLSGDPTAIDLTAGEAEIPLRLYADWHSRKGVTFTATNIDTGARTVVDVDDYGNGPLVVTSAGVWRVEFHYLIDLRDNDEGPGGIGQQEDEKDAIDFELHSATLTFMMDEGASR